MNRHKEREQAFRLVFESEFGNSIDEIIESKRLCEEEISDFAREILVGVEMNGDNIKEYIEKNARGWKINRLSVVTRTILKIAIYEMMYIENIPMSVSINEAVELGKKYGAKSESNYINGVLGQIFKNLSGGVKS